LKSVPKQKEHTAGLTVDIEYKTEIMSKTELLEVLKSTKAETVSYFSLSENELSKSYGKGKWNVRQILHHLTDTEFLFAGRLKKIIAEPKQVIWAFNQDEWDKVFDYEYAPLHGKKEIYEVCREMNYVLTDKYYDLFLHKVFVHSETGLRTLKDEFEKVAIHNKSHNEQISKALSLGT
jgi:hypothetical protein